MDVNYPTISPTNLSCSWRGESPTHNYTCALFAPRIIAHRCALLSALRRVPRLPYVHCYLTRPCLMLLPLLLYCFDPRGGVVLSSCSSFDSLIVTSGFPSSSFLQGERAKVRMAAPRSWFARRLFIAVASGSSHVPTAPGGRCVPPRGGFRAHGREAGTAPVSSLESVRSRAEDSVRGRA